MPYPPSLLVGTYSDARAALENREITQAGGFSRMGAESMTKTCYQCNQFGGWVYLVSSNKRILEAEVQQLRRYGEYMRTPYLGSADTDDLVFELKRRGDTVYGFLEMRFTAGYKEVKVKSDQDGTWMYREVLLNLKSTQQLTSLLEFITAADKYLAGATEDIPDFQVAWDPGYGLMFLFDPGDPENWGSALDSHRKAITRWIKEATCTRLAKSIAMKEAMNEAESSPSSSTTSPVQIRTPSPSVTPKKSTPLIAAVVTPVPKQTIAAVVIEPRVEPDEDYMCHDCKVVFPSVIKLRTHRLLTHN